MKTLRIKTGTKAEIVKYMRSKTKNKTVSHENFLPWECKKNELFELDDDTIEQQIDMFVRSGSPWVNISLASKNGFREYREQFILTDFSTLRTDMEIAKCDDLELRNKKMETIKMLMDMEMDAEERWNKILKVMNDFKGVTLPFEFV